MRVFIVLALSVAIGLATAASPFASSAPDGLEKVAEREGFLDEGRSRDAPIPDYAFPGIRDDRLATGAAGFAGTLLVLAAGWGAIRLVRRPVTA
jgi:PDGLE domain